MVHAVTPQELSPRQLADAADDNMAMHAMWIPQRTAGMRVIERSDLVLVDSGLPCDSFNVICRARLAGDKAADRIGEAIGFFQPAARPFSWWVSPADEPPEIGDLLLAAGLYDAETELGMVMDLADLEIAPIHGLRIERIRTPSQLGDFAQIIAENWNPPESSVLEFYNRATAVLEPDAPLWLYVGYHDAIPVATAELTVSTGVVGLYNISTREVHRRQGFGSALALQPLLDAREHGYRTAVLQAAPAGVGVYTRLGFRPYGTITEYKLKVILSPA